MPPVFKSKKYIARISEADFQDEYGGGKEQGVN
jgi:hypothetical protein